VGRGWVVSIQVWRGGGAVNYRLGLLLTHHTYTCKYPGRTSVKETAKGRVQVRGQEGRRQVYTGRVQSRR
jgi:hypothetical protein